MTTSGYGDQMVGFGTIGEFGHSVRGGTDLARIVIVDDNADIRQLLRDYLSIDGEGLELVGEATNGAEGIRVVEELRPAAVILDWQMPVLEGPAAVPGMRAAVPDLVIVMYSSRGSYAQDEALAAGIDRYIDKGSGPAAVIATLRELLA